MGLNIQDLNKETLKDAKRVLLTICSDYEPWADFMMLGGAGDPGVDHFPLDLFSGEIESIDITMAGREGPQ